MPDAKPAFFAKHLAEVFDTFEVEVTFRDRVMGGCPKNADVIAG